MEGIRLIGKKEQDLPADVEILFKTRSVPRLTLTKLYFWNSGTETVRGDEIVADDPLRCVFDSEDEILTARVAAVTRKVNKFSVAIQPQKAWEALISFDYLDSNDGARIELLHTSVRKYPDVSGSIRGIPKGLKQLTSSRPVLFDSVLDRVLRRKNFFYSIALVFGIVMLAIGFLPDSWFDAVRQLLESKKSGDPSLQSRGMRIPFLITGLLYIVMPLASLLAKRRKYPPVLDSESESEK